MNVGKFREILRDALHILDDYPSTDEIELKSNTYFLGSCRFFVGISGFDGGYVSLDNIGNAIITSDDDDDEDEFED